MFANFSFVWQKVEIYKILTAALTQKLPLPPQNWSVAQLTYELWDAGSEFEPNAFLRQQEALTKCLYYLVDYSRRMPSWINLATGNARVRQMCEKLAEEIEKITFQSEAVIASRGKLKSRLYAILNVQTCLIYREETARKIAELDKAKRLNRLKRPVKNTVNVENPRSDKWQSALAKTIFQKSNRNNR